MNSCIFKTKTARRNNGFIFYYSAPKMAWDWREYATAYGPFESEEEANEHLSTHHANPGGYNIIEVKNPEGMDDILKELIENARKEKEKKDKFSANFQMWIRYRHGWETW